MHRLHAAKESVVSVVMRLKVVNRILSLLVLGLGLYLVGQPLYPAVKLAITIWLNPQGGYPYASHLAEAAGVESSATPEGDRLVIPSIQVDGEIVTGSDPIALDQGIWLRPQGATPDQKSNTVLAAHRYLYKAGPNTFYNLDKVTIGEQIAVFWEDREYNYRVTEINEVAADATEVEEPTSTSVLTLYTCTPIWTASRRLVVKAELIGDYPRL